MVLRLGENEIKKTASQKIEDTHFFSCPQAKLYPGSSPPGREKLVIPSCTVFLKTVLPQQKKKRGGGWILCQNRWVIKERELMSSSNFWYLVKVSVQYSVLSRYQDCDEEFTFCRFVLDMFMYFEI